MASKRTPSLPDAEIQVIADAALAAWESGVIETLTDSSGALWRFVPVRDANTRLDVARLRPVQDDPDILEILGGATLSQAELGTENVRHVLASRVLAVVQPA